MFFENLELLRELQRERDAQMSLARWRFLCHEANDSDCMQRCVYLREPEGRDMIKMQKIC